MSDLMQVMFHYIMDYRTQKYLASDLEYQENPHDPNKYLQQLAALLDDAGRQLLEQYCQCVRLEHRAIDRALFQATLEICRELHAAM